MIRKVGILNSKVHLGLLSQYLPLIDFMARIKVKEDLTPAGPQDEEKVKDKHENAKIDIIEKYCVFKDLH